MFALDSSKKIFKKLKKSYSLRLTEIGDVLLKKASVRKSLSWPKTQGYRRSGANTLKIPVTMKSFILYISLTFYFQLTLINLS